MRPEIQNIRLSYKSTMKSKPQLKLSHTHGKFAMKEGGDQTFVEGRLHRFGFPMQSNSPTLA